MFQGEELGLFEVADLPEEVLQDPIWARSGHRHKGRDGCRVPLPWCQTGESFGFGGRPSLPQPGWFGPLSVEAQAEQRDSTLALYRRVLRLRRRLRDQPGFAWVESPPGSLAFARGRWRVATNLGAEPVELPAGNVLVWSSPGTGRTLPADATAWLWS